MVRLQMQTALSNENSHALRSVYYDHMYGNTTFYAYLELVTSQDWRHNIAMFKKEKSHLSGLVSSNN